MSNLDDFENFEQPPQKKLGTWEKRKARLWRITRFVFNDVHQKLLVSVMSNFKTRYIAVVANLRRNRRFVFTELTEIICQQPAMIGSNALFKNISFEKRKNFNICRVINLRELLFRLLVYVRQRSMKIYILTFYSVLETKQEENDC